MTCNISRVTRKNITYNLIYRIISFFLQRLIHREHNAMDFCILLSHKIEFAREVVHSCTTLLLISILL